ncbi:hypothetical protein RV02_GL001427 [Enterococcus gilvus]|nr:hypothetical protein RV02_GL001427 [Enterococcus gilvus]
MNPFSKDIPVYLQLSKELDFLFSTRTPYSSCSKLVENKDARNTQLLFYTRS